MEFNELLNDYISRLGCTAKELSHRSGVSASVISRYRAGERIPSTDSEQIMRLASGISAIATEKGFTDILREDIYSALVSTITHFNVDFDLFTDKLNTLIYILGINLTELARSMNFDVSFLSKVRSGQRKPADIESFVDGVCSFVSEHFSSEEYIPIVAEALSVSVESLNSKQNYESELKNWFKKKPKVHNATFSEFLRRLDEFDLDEYIHGIELEELTPIHNLPDISVAKNYYGKTDMRRGFLDFFNLTLHSDSTDPIFIAADFPFHEIAYGVIGSNPFVSHIVSCIKKGIRINIVHDFNKQTEELIADLKIWVPLYMTGLVSPYYLKEPTGEIYKNLTCVSGVAALHGECICENIDEGKMYLTNNVNEINYYQRKANAIIRKAHPLIEVYTEKQKNIFLSMLESDAMTPGKRHQLLTTLPIYTIPDELLTRILERNGFADDRDYLLHYVQRHRKIMKRILATSEVTDEVIVPTKEEFEEEQISVSIVGTFYGNKLHYNYDEYMEHLRATLEYEKNNSNYRLVYSDKNIFRNIRLALHEDKWVIVSKNKAPIVHFIIRHPGFRKIIDIYSADTAEK